MADLQGVDELSLERGMQLLQMGVEDITGYLGYLSNQHETYQAWQGKAGIVVPQWDDEEKWFEYNASTERGAMNDWWQEGSAFFKEKVEPYLKKALCENGECRKEIKDMESDVKDLLKYLCGIIGGFLTVSLPAAAVSISVAIAVLLIKKGLRDVCKD